MARALTRFVEASGSAVSPRIDGISIECAREAARLGAMNCPRRKAWLARTLARVVFCGLLFSLVGGVAGGVAGGSAVVASPKRIVSLNPSLTGIMVALGAEQFIVGVDDYSAGKIPAVASVPRVGGLFSPSLEAVVALRPDLVILVPSSEQRDFRRRLEELGVPVIAFKNIRFAEVLSNIRRLGVLVEREAEAQARIDAIEAARDAARRLGEVGSPPGVVVILQRDPVYVVGGGNFIQEMLEVLGANNLASEFSEPYPRVAVEWVVAGAPDVLIDLSPVKGEALEHWSRWPSIPAVTTGRVVALDAELISMPGPDLDRAFELLAEGLYGAAPGGDHEPAAKAAMEGERNAIGGSRRENRP